MENKTWICHGQAFTLDLNTLDGLDRYDKALDAQRSVFAALPAGASEPRKLIAYCEGIRVLLDALFGDGKAALLLPGDAAVTDYDDVYESFTDFVRTQTEATAERREKLLRKYKPAPNREQRRALERIAERLGNAK